MINPGLLAIISFSAMITQSENPLVLAKEAFDASKKNLTSGIGDGILEIYANDLKESELHLKEKARCMVYFQGDKFHIRLKYEKYHKESGISRIIICDGKRIISSFVSPRVRPVGANASMFEVDTGYSANAMKTAGFPFYPQKLQDSVLRVDLLKENVGKISLEFDRKPNGGFTGSWKDGKIRAKFECSPESGFNVSSYTVSDGGAKPFQDFRAAWEHKNGVWFVESVSRTLDMSNGQKEKSVFTYSKFEVNPHVDPSLFHFDALELPEGALISDNNPRGGPPAYFNRSSAETEPKSVDDLLEEVKVRSKSKEEKPPLNLGKYFTTSIVALGFLLSLTGLALMWHRRKKAAGG